MSFFLVSLNANKTENLGGPYAAFGGRDASRGLATFNVTSSDTEEYDDLSDLDTMEMESVREWELQFKGMHGHGQPTISLNQL